MEGGEWSPSSKPEVPRGLVVRVERDASNPLVTSTGRQAFVSAVTTFNLAVIGGSILPTPYCFAKTGGLVGMLLVLLAALCNDYTSCLMVEAVYETGLDSFESLALWAGGPACRRFTQLVLLALLWVPNAGGLQLIGDVSQVLISTLAGHNGTTQHTPAAAASSSGLVPLAFAPGAAAASNGSITGSGGLAASLAGAPRALLGEPAGGAEGGWAAWLTGDSLMVLITIAVVLPLSCQKHMRSLEGAATGGLFVLLGLLLVLAGKAWAAGFPAIASGEFALASLQVDWGSLPEAFSLLGFAFYLQPLMMPMIREMPEGRTGRRALTAAVHTTLLGSSLALYAGIGFFGASLFGAATNGNVLLNHVTDSKAATVVLYSSMLAYLAAGAAACQYPLRTSLDALLVGEHVPLTRARSALINAVTLAVSLAMALVTPGGAEQIYAVVGASGVCIVCYVLPVAIHVRLLAARAAAGRFAKRRSHTHLAAPAPRGELEQLLTGPPSPHSSASSLTGLRLPPTRATVLLLPLPGPPGAPHALPAAPLLQPTPLLLSPLAGGACAGWAPQWLVWAGRLALPLTVCGLGVAFSVAALVGLLAPGAAR